MIDPGQQSYAFGGCVINVANRELLADGRQVEVQHRVFNLLLYLIENRDRAISKDELLEQVWAGRITTDAALARVVMKARKAVGDNASDQKVIKTLHGHGYQFIAPMHSIGERAGTDLMDWSGNERLTDLGSGSKWPRRSGKLSKRHITLLLTITAILSLLLFYFAVDKFVLDPARDAEMVKVAAQQARTDVIVDSYGNKSIAVLPFINLGDDVNNEYFSDGVSEELLNLLAKIPDLRVISRTSAFSFKGKDVDIPSIARQLKVANILEGSVRKAGDRVRIAVQLIDARSDTHLWSETYERTLEDIFAIQDEIAREVAKELEIALMGDLPEARQVDPEAYAKYLQGLHFFHRRSRDDLDNAIGAFNQAVATEPDYALAWVGLGMAIIAKAVMGYSDMEYASVAARRAIDRALSLDPTLPEAHAVLAGWKMRLAWDWQGAAESLQRAESLDPANPIVLVSKAHLSLATGKVEESIALHEKVLESDPLNIQGHYFLAIALQKGGRLDEAEKAYRLGYQLNPMIWFIHRNLGRLYLLMNRPEIALQEFEQESHPAYRMQGMAMAYYSLGRTEDSELALNALVDQYAHLNATQIAEAYAWLGELDEAFKWLEIARDQRQFYLWTILWTPFLHELENDARWEAFLETIGLSTDQRASLILNDSQA